MPNQHILTAWAEEHAQLEVLLAETVADRNQYRLIACAALDQLHRTTQTLTRTQAQLYRLARQAREGSLMSTGDIEKPARTFTTKHGTRRGTRSTYRRTTPTIEARQ